MKQPKKSPVKPVDLHDLVIHPIPTRIIRNATTYAKDGGRVVIVVSPLGSVFCNQVRYPIGYPFRELTSRLRDVLTSLGRLGVLEKGHAEQVTQIIEQRRRDENWGHRAECALDLEKAGGIKFTSDQRRQLVALTRRGVKSVTSKATVLRKG